MTDHRALEATVDGVVLRLCVPPAGGGFMATVGNVPRSYMRAYVVASNRAELRRWQMPDVQQNQTIAFRMVDVASDKVVSTPDEISAIHPDIHDDDKRAARELKEAVMETMAVRRDLYQAKQALKESLRVLALVQAHIKGDSEAAKAAALLVAKMLSVHRDAASSLE